jgi:Type II CAAX prenyl endopeptidase Rce1-like
MSRKSFRVFTVVLPVKRPFHWPVFAALVILYFLGNIAGVPLLRRTNAPVEPVWFWGIATLVSALAIALSLVMANRTGLGAPLLEGRLSREDLPDWLRSGLALTVLMLTVGLPFSLTANLGADPASYPLGWELLPASFKAGVVEEVGYRLLFVSLFVWVGRFFRHDAEGRPSRGVFWAAIVLAGLIFGWAHIDARLGNPAVPIWGYVLVMALSSVAGIYFGWLFWKLGLEWAVFAHFIYDAFVSLVVIPVYLLRSPVVWVILLAGLVIASVMSWRFLTQKQPNVGLRRT